ncbi:hypothetical protein [Limnohabitans sp.]|nr:hypothetical protein [Limnohabitans sp.]
MNTLSTQVTGMDKKDWIAGLDKGLGQVWINDAITYVPVAT